MGSYWLDPRGDKANAETRRAFSYDPEGAKKLLAEAGYPNGFTANYHMSTSLGPQHVQLGELVHGYLGRIGVRLNTIVEDFASVFVTKTFVGNYDGLAWNYEGVSEPGMVLDAMYKPRGSRNQSNVNEPEVTALVDAVQSELNVEKRRQMILDIQNTLAPRMYYAPVVWWAGPIWTAFAPQVKDATDHLTVRGQQNSVRSAYAWFDR
jgi:peptide/nickel transport system substrate-binding protein